MSIFTEFIDKAKEVPAYKYAIFILSILVILLIGMQLSSKSKRSSDININCPSCESVTVESTEVDDDDTTEDEQSSHNSGKPTITCYYTEWCGHSRMFLPEWDKFEEYAKTNLQNIKVKKVNCEKNAKKCSKNSVSGYPTVILVTPTGSQVKYDRDRTAKELINFCKEYSK